MKTFVKISFAAVLFAALVFTAGAQNSTNDARPEEEVVKFGKKIHDFGDILLTDKNVECTFEFKNISKKPVVVHNVVSSCGCTVPKWTREPVMPGKTGSIKVMFKNDQGPFPFKKSVTAYISGVNRPVVLQIKGTVYGKKMTLREMYTHKIGDVLATKETTFLVGNMYQGKAKSDASTIANLSKSPVKVTVKSEDPALSVAIVPNPVPANGKSTITYTVNTANGEKKWGKNEYFASFSLDGKQAAEKLKVVAVIAEDFDGYTQAMRDKGPIPTFDQGYLDMGEVSKGKVVDHTIVIKNTGKSPLTIYKIDSEDGNAQILTQGPVKIAVGKSAEFKIKFNTSGIDAGEFVSVLTFTTNSPLRPRLDFFVNGIVK